MQCNCPFADTDWLLYSLHRMLSVTSLKDRIIRAPSLSHSDSHSSSSRPQQDKNWEEERLCKAYEAVQREHMTAQKAPDVYRVPKSTFMTALQEE